MYAKGGLMTDKLNLQRLGVEDSTPVHNHNPSISESSINSFFLNEFWEDYSKYKMLDFQPEAPLRYKSK